MQLIYFIKSTQAMLLFHLYVRWLIVSNDLTKKRFRETVIFDLS